ncbi:MAG: hypothetical protein U0768_10300 [Anaerolineae bacterium]
MATAPAGARHRTWAVWILVIMAVLMAAWAIVMTFQYLGLMFVNFGPMNFFGQALFGAFMWGILALIWLAVASWLYTLQPSGWLFVVIITIFNLILNFVSWIGGTPGPLLGVSSLLNLIALGLAFLPGTQRAFGRR